MRRWVALVMALALLPWTALAGAPEALDAVFERYDTLGACVAVFQNGRIVWVHCYGQVAPGAEAVTPETAFQVGSISKLVTGMALIQLVENGCLGLDDPLGDALGFAVENPEYPGQPVTLRQLMTHTAGLRDSAAYDRALEGDIEPLDELLESRFSFEPGIAPGTRRQYSNFGGGLAGSVVEALSGQSLDEYAAEHLFEPLGIAAAYQPALLPAQTPLADLYYMPSGRLARELKRDEPPFAGCDPLRHYTLAAGKLIISAPDLGRLLITLCDGGISGEARLLKPSSVAEMLQPQNDRGSVSCQSDNGLFVNILTDAQVQGRTLYGHGGKANGMLCAAYFDPTDRTGAVMLTNGCRNDSEEDGVGLLGREVLTLCYESVIGPDPVVEDPFLVSE